MPQNFTDISDLVRAAQPPQQISYGGPEKIPIPRPPEVSKDHVEIHEVAEHEPEPEVKPYVEPRPEKVEIPQDVEEQGVESTGHSNFPTYNSVKLPISDEKVLQGLKTPISSSVRWLAEFCLFILRKAHIKLKTAHGKAVRMFDGR
jgi:hypothetical protein